MLVGRYQGKRCQRKHNFEAAGKFTAGKITEDEMYDLEIKASRLWFLFWIIYS